MTRNFPTGDLRVSDAERDAALAELSEHFQAGRLTQEEFDERSGRALSARTGNDLRELFTDLPAPGEPTGPPVSAAPKAAVAPPGPAPVAHGGGWPVGRVVIACVIAAIVLGNVTVSVGHGVSHASFGWLIPVIILLIVFRGIGGRPARGRRHTRVGSRHTRGR
jgi:hypothetical protein